MYKRRKSVIIIASCLIAVGIFVYVTVLVQNGVVCIARTGKEPPAAYFENPDVFKEDVRRVKNEVFAVIKNQFDEETGFFVYAMDPNGAISEENNAIRQLLASRVLALESRNSEEVLRVHQKNLDAIFTDWYKEEGDVAFVYYDEKSKLGANAMLLRVLVASPDFPRYESEALKLARGVISLMDEDGSFSAWLIEPDYEFDEENLLTFYSGEAILALLEYAEATQNEGVHMAAEKAQDFYLTEYVENIDENYYPAYVPWHTQSLALLYELTGEEKYRDAVFILNDKLLEIQDRERYIGRFYNPETPQYGSPHASSDAVYTEGLAHAYGVAKTAGDKLHEKKFHDAVIYGTYNLKQLQHRAHLWQFFMDREAKERLNGGIRTNACNDSVRIDTLAHTYDALTEILE